MAEARGAVAIARRGGLLGQVEGLLGLVGAENLQGLLVEGVEAVHQVARLVGGLEAFVEAFEQLVAVIQLVELEVVGQLDSARLQRAAATLAAAGAFDDERVIGGAEVTGLPRAAAKVAESYVGRHAAFVRQKAVRQRAEARIL